MPGNAVRLYRGARNFASALVPASVLRVCSRQIRWRAWPRWSRRETLDALPATAFLHDTTTRNVIVTPAGSLSGIVDVDDLCFGDPRYTPALTMAVLLAHNGPLAYVEHWMRVAGQRDNGLFRLYVALFLVDLMSEHGQRFNDNERRSTPQWPRASRNPAAAAVRPRCSARRSYSSLETFVSSALDGREFAFELHASGGMPIGAIQSPMTFPNTQRVSPARTQHNS